MNRLAGSPWALPVGALLASRVVIAIGLARGSGHASPADLLHIAASRYDGSWYALITRHGYAIDEHAPAFYPGYPLVARIVWTLVPNLDLALVVASLLCLVLACVCLYRIYAPRWGSGVAVAGILLLGCSPAGLFFALAFSESAFLAAVAATFLFASRRRWLVAGAAGAAACLVRFNGAFLAVPLLLMAIEARAWRRPARLLGGAAIFAAGAAAYPAYLGLALGDPLRYAHLQQTFWHHHLTNPVRPIDAGLRRMLAALRALVTLHRGGVRPPDGAAVLTDGAMLIAAAATLAVGIRRLTAAEWSWVLLVLLPPLLVFEVPDSMARYLLAAFPMYFLAAGLLRRVPAVTAGLVVIGLAFQGELAFRLAQGFFVG